MNNSLTITAAILAVIVPLCFLLTWSMRPTAAFYGLMVVALAISGVVFLG